MTVYMTTIDGNRAAEITLADGRTITLVDSTGPDGQGRIWLNLTERGPGVTRLYLQPLDGGAWDVTSHNDEISHVEIA